MTRRALLVPFAALALASAGCGSSGSSSSTGSSASTGASSSASSGGAYGSTGAAAATTPASSGSSSGSDLKISAQESNGLSFDHKTLSAKAGTVTITMANPSGDSQPHGVALSGAGVSKSGKVVQPGGTSTVTLKLKPGKYTFYCPVPGHRQAGMEGTLTVQ